MRYQLPDQITKEYVDEFITNIIKPIMDDVRKNLSLRFNVHYGVHANYTGLCDIASDMFKDHLCNYTDTFIQPGAVTVEIHHGEQKHSPKISSYYWGMQHTWNVVYLGDFVIYVDCTCGQFSKFYKNIPQTYVSITPPPWWIDDRDNKALGRSELKINKIIKLPVFGEEKIQWVGIMDILTYYVWGAISDMIGFIFGMRKIIVEDEI